MGRAAEKAARKAEAAAVAGVHRLAPYGQQFERVACLGCGEMAVGLRKCGQCKLAGYCSRECQIAHWPQHKRNCQPAA